MESRRRGAFLGSLVVLLPLCVAFAADAPVPGSPRKGDDAEIRKLILQLADGSYEVREEAMLALDAVGEPALPFLKVACASDDPEVRERAAQLSQGITVRVILDDPDNRELKRYWELLSGENPKMRAAAIRRWAEAKGGMQIQGGGAAAARGGFEPLFDAAACREAVRAWIKRRGLNARTVEALLKILQADPDGLAGFAAADALNLVCAPRAVGKLERSGIASAGGEPMSAWAHLDDLSLDMPLVATPEAQANLSSAIILPRDEDSGHPYLDEVRMACAAAGVLYRLSDDANEVHLELPSQACDQWRAWWNGIKDNQPVLMDMGLIPSPEGVSLAQGDLEVWIGWLASQDPRVARLARRVLRDVPDALLPEIGRRAGAPGASPALVAENERLLLRDKGWLLVRSDRDGGPGWYMMKLDGSAVRKVSGSLEKAWFADPCGDQAVAYGDAKGADGKGGIYRYDLRGGSAPELVTDAYVGHVFPSPDGRFLAIRQDNPGGSGETLRVLDVRTRELLLSEAMSGTPSWSPDSRKFVWKVSYEAGGLRVHDFQTGKTLSFEKCQPHYRVFWSPDGRRIVFSNRNIEHSAPVEDWSHQMDVIDLENGERKTISGPHQYMYEPAWSPDGKRIAFSWFDEKEGGPRGPAIIEVYDMASSSRVTRANPVPVPADTQGTCRWMPDGKSLLFHQPNDMEGGIILDLETGESSSLPDFDTFHGKPIPGMDWFLIITDGDIILRRLKDGRTINLTECASNEDGAEFIAFKR